MDLINCKILKRSFKWMVSGPNWIIQCCGILQKFFWTPFFSESIYFYSTMISFLFWRTWKQNSHWYSLTLSRVGYFVIIRLGRGGVPPPPPLTSWYLRSCIYKAVINILIGLLQWSIGYKIFKTIVKSETNVIKKWEIGLCWMYKIIFFLVDLSWACFDPF